MTKTSVNLSRLFKAISFIALATALSGCAEPEPIVCEESIPFPQPQITTDDSNLQRCRRGALERFKAESCTNRDLSCTQPSDFNECNEANDCPGDEMCFSDSEGCYCGQPDLGCRSDADCSASQACLCGYLREANSGDFRQPQVCIEAECRTTADCPTGEHCLLSFQGCEEPRLTCVGPTDECIGQADCREGFDCVTDGDSRRCRETRCIIG